MQGLITLRRAAVLVAAIAALLVAAAPAGAKSSVAACHTGYYKNVSGHCVHRPVHSSSVPAGATARCRDGSYSFSEHASGTCSGHGGVGRWIHHP